MYTWKLYLLIMNLYPSREAKSLGVTLTDKYG